ncbi:MAG: AI-2E family transporter [Pseudomonadota bacterium]
MSGIAVVPDRRRPPFAWGWLIVIIVLGWFLFRTASVIPPFAAGIVIAYLLDPLTDRLEALGIKRWLATLIMLALFFSVLTGIGFLIVPLLMTETRLLIGNVPALVDALRPLAERLYDEAEMVVDLDGIADTLLQRLAEIAAGVLRAALDQGLALFNVLALVVIMPIVAFYSLRDFDILTVRIRSWIPPRYSARLERLARDIDIALGGFIRGQFLVCSALAIFYAAGWSLTGLDYALVLGLIAGIMAFVPYLGAVISVALALIVGFGQFGPEPLPLILILVVFQVGQILEGSILTPNLIGERIGLHPLWVLFAVFAGGELAGIWGVFLAVPVAAVLGVIVRAVLDTYLHSPIYSGQAPAPASMADRRDTE